MLYLDRIQRPLLALMLVLSAGCAASAGAGAGEMDAADGDGIAVQINNNVIPPTAITVYAVPETGARQLLGNMSPSANQTFRYNPVGLASGQFRLVAQPTAGGEIASRPFTLVNVSAVEWDMNLNTIETR